MRADWCGCVLALGIAGGCGRIAFGGGAGNDADGGDDAAQACGAITELADDFEDGAIAPRWMLVQDPGVGVVEAGGRLTVSLPDTRLGAGGYHSSCLYDARDHAISVEVVTTPTVAPGAEMFLDLRLADEMWRVGIVISDGGLQAHERLGGAFIGLSSVAFDPLQHRFWQLREAGGTMFWEASPDRMVWTALATEPTPFDLSAVRVFMRANEFQLTANPGQAVFDNVIAE